MISAAGCTPATARVAVLRLTHEQAAHDLRNVMPLDIVSELAAFGVKAVTHGPERCPNGLLRHYGMPITPAFEFCHLDALILAVPHAARVADAAHQVGMVLEDGASFNVSAALPAEAISSKVTV